MCCVCHEEEEERDQKTIMRERSLKGRQEINAIRITWASVMRTRARGSQCRFPQFSDISGSVPRTPSRREEENNCKRSQLSRQISGAKANLPDRRSSSKLCAPPPPPPLADPDNGSKRTLGDMNDDAAAAETEPRSSRARTVLCILF